MMTNEQRALNQWIAYKSRGQWIADFDGILCEAWNITRVRFWTIVDEYYGA